MVMFSKTKKEDISNKFGMNRVKFGQEKFEIDI
jgi:hypothetical protein